MSNSDILRNRVLNSVKYQAGEPFDAVNIGRKHGNHEISMTTVRQVMRQMAKEGLVKKVDGDIWKRSIKNEHLLFRPLCNQKALQEIREEQQWHDDMEAAANAPN